MPDTGRKPEATVPSLPVAQHQQPPAATPAYDVFLSHCGGTDRYIKMVLGFVRRYLHDLPSTPGGSPIRAFRDEDDLKDTGKTHHALRAAVLQSMIGARSDMLVHLSAGG